MVLRFESVSSSDADELVNLRIAAMRDSLERIGRFDPQRARERFLATFDPAFTRFVLREEIRIGFVVWLMQKDCLFLNHLYVLPDSQGQGVGTWVLKQIFCEADEAGLPVKVGALRGSDANRFYLRNGFEQTHEEEFDIYYLRAAP